MLAPLKLTLRHSQPICNYNLSTTTAVQQQRATYTSNPREKYFRVHGGNNEQLHALEDFHQYDDSLGPMMRINRNVRRLKPSATVAINELSNELRSQGMQIYKLGLGQSPFPVPSPVVESLKKHAHEKDYLPVKGLPALRQVVADYYSNVVGEDSLYTKDDVIIGPGSKELMFILQAVYQADLVVPMGSWVSYAPQARILGGSVIWIPPSQNQPPASWRLSADALEEVCKRDPTCPRLLILNYPNNPTGDTYTADELEAIANVARKYRVMILSDEIYAELNHENNHTSIAKFYPEGTIISGGISKWAGAGGYRMGAFVVPQHLRWLLNLMGTVASETYTSVSAPIQYASVTAYTPNPKIAEYLEKSRAVVRELGRTIHGKLEAAGIQCTPPRGGFYLMPDLTQALHSNPNKQHIKTADEMCHTLLKETGIACLPGSDFGVLPEDLVTRIAYVNFDGEAALNDLPSAKDCNKAFVEQHCQDTIKAIDLLCDWVKN